MADGAFRKFRVQSKLGLSGQIRSSEMPYVSYMRPLVIIMNKIVLLILFFYASQAIGQNKSIGVKEVYFESGIGYKVSDDKRFSGIAQKKRRNGNVVYEQFFNNGILEKDIVYFNNSEGNIASIRYYDQKYPLILRKEENFRQSIDWKGIIVYDENGKRIYEEQFENGDLTYRCEYNGKKKHGQEICCNKDGTQTIYEYINGKRKKRRSPTKN